jgi:hypothetical protein
LPGHEHEPVQKNQDCYCPDIEEEDVRSRIRYLHALKITREGEQKKTSDVPVTNYIVSHELFYLSVVTEVAEERPAQFQYSTVPYVQLPASVTVARAELAVLAMLPLQH